MSETGYKTLNQMTWELSKAVLRGGEFLPSRNGNCWELMDANSCLENPQYRHLYLKGRTSNIYATIAETFWVLAGQAALDPLMNFFLPRAKDFSDDGKIWRAAYGPRLKRGSQVHHVVDSLVQDKLSRQAVMTLWDPSLDTVASMEFTATKDRPCSNLLLFAIRNNRLICKLQMRSNDVIFGMSHINVFEFTLLQELILEILKNISPDYSGLELGEYRHSAFSLHIYESTASQAHNLLKDNDFYDTLRLCGAKSIRLGGSDIYGESLHSFFGELYFGYANRINGLQGLTIDSVFQKWRVPVENNQLYDYARILDFYLDSKLGVSSSMVDFYEFFKQLSPDFQACLKANQFTPDEWAIKDEVQHDA